MVQILCFSCTYSIFWSTVLAIVLLLQFDSHSGVMELKFELGV
jgi:hypothetical protein